MASPTKYQTKSKKTWVRGAVGAAALAAVILAAGLVAGRGGNSTGAVATPSGSRTEENASAVRTASLRTVILPQDPPAADAALSPQARADKVKALLDGARQALSGDDLERAEKGISEALRLDPSSKTAGSLKRDLEEKREKAKQEEIRKKVADYQDKGLDALANSDVEGALRAFEAAQALDPADARTFRLIEHVHRVRSQQESKQRRQAFREGGRAGSDLVVENAASDSSLRASARPGEYVIQPEDVLQVTVFEEPDLTTKARVSRNGEITFPLLGQVAVVGLTVGQAQERLARLLGDDYLVHPQVQVFVDKPRNVFVTGEVHRPGSYPVSVERETTIMEIISMAGGFSDDADLNGTRIIRVESGQKKTIRVRVGDIVHKGDKSQDVGVLPDDIVFVPESFF